jgi:hypothetical protein
MAGGLTCELQVFRKFQAYAEEAGLAPEKRHPHVLMHSIASRLVGNPDVTDVSSGWATSRYRQLCFVWNRMKSSLRSAYMRQ